MIAFMRKIWRNFFVNAVFNYNTINDINFKYNFCECVGEKICECSFNFNTIKDIYSKYNFL